MFSVDEFWILVVLFVCTTSAVDRPVGEIVLGLCFVCSDKSYSEVGAEIFGFFLEYLDVYSHAQASVWSVTDCCRRSTRFFFSNVFDYFSSISLQSISKTANVHGCLMV